MKDGLEYLKEVGIEKLHRDTYINEKSLKAILNKEFEKINEVQFHGFVDILAKQYNLNLDDLIIEFDFFHREYIIRQEELFLQAQPERLSINFNKIFIYTVIVLILLFGLYYKISSQSNKGLFTEMQTVRSADDIESFKDLDSILQKKSDLNIDANTQEEYLKQDLVDFNSNSQREKFLETGINIYDFKKEEEKEEEPKSYFYIKPRKELWIGIVDLKTREKTQVMTSDRFDLNTSKDYLIIIGHGEVSLVHNDRIIELNTSNRHRFIYKNNELNETTKLKFRAMNGGYDW